MKFLKNAKLSTRMATYFCILTSIIAIFLYFLLPFLLNYPPNTINTKFDKEVSVIYYVYQYLIAIIFILLLGSLYFKHALKKIDKWCAKPTSDIKTVLEIRKICLSLPYKLFLSIEFLPTLIVILVLQCTGSHPPILLFKIGILIFSIATLLSSLFLIISKNTLYPVLKQTSNYLHTDMKNGKLSLRLKLMFQLFPGILVTALMISLIGYSRLTVEKGTLLNTYYKSAIQNSIEAITEETLDIYPSDIFKDLSNKLIGENDFIFVEFPDETVVTSNGSILSHFFLKYMHELASEHNDTAYEAYTIDAQGVIQHLQYKGLNYTIGIYYEIASYSLFYYFLLSSFLLFGFNVIVLLYMTKSISEDISKVTEGLNEIVEHNDSTSNKKLPITSDDILGELAQSFNKIQDLTNANIEQIHDNQDLLMEKERLASLGQLIGGIAHNLKTPIMSIAGATEGLTDLVKEYDSSIEDPEVNAKDHHDIAHDMAEWVEKIKTHTSYMSDVITAVKGQAVTLSEQQENTFTLDELVKRITILMRHELKNALIELNVHMETDSNLNLNGNVNSLIQVINNMISNAIQSYNGEHNKTIDMFLHTQDNALIISIQDYGMGMSKEVQNKLFKEMITTKGKNGTGLGLFMSYSNIRGHFNGNITFESEVGKGTIFNIILPL